MERWLKTLWWEGWGKIIFIIELENKNGTIITVFKYLEGQYMDEGFILLGVAPEAKLNPMKQSSSQSKQLNIDITDLMDMSLNMLLMDREAWHGAVHGGCKESDTTKRLN